MAVLLLRAVLAAMRNAWPTRLVCLADGPPRRLSPLMRVPGAKPSHEQKWAAVAKRDRSAPTSAATVRAGPSPRPPSESRSSRPPASGVAARAQRSRGHAAHRGERPPSSQPFSPLSRTRPLRAGDIGHSSYFGIDHGECVSIGGARSSVTPVP